MSRKYCSSHEYSYGPLFIPIDSLELLLIVDISWKILTLFTILLIFKLTLFVIRTVSISSCEGKIVEAHV